MEIIEKLTQKFKSFPGIGERQAKRFAYFLMSQNKNYIKDLISLIQEINQNTLQCPECFRFFIPKKNLNSNKCEICQHASNETLIIVEKDSDLESIQKSGFYQGKYFILSALIPIVEKNIKNKIHIKELKKRLEESINLQEIILAFSLTPQGEHTDFYLRNELKDICLQKNIKISSLGKGLSTGTELEYSDNNTLHNALKNRQ